MPGLIVHGQIVTWLARHDRNYRIPASFKGTLRDSIRPREDLFEAFPENFKRALFLKRGSKGPRRHTMTVIVQPRGRDGQQTSTSLHGPVKQGKTGHKGRVR